jgi:hypothetical protein
MTGAQVNVQYLHIPFPGHLVKRYYLLANLISKGKP